MKKLSLLLLCGCLSSSTESGVRELCADEVEGQICYVRCSGNQKLNGSLTITGTETNAGETVTGTATFSSTANFTSAIALGSVLVESATLPTLTGFCTSPSVTTHGTWSFDINVGSACATNTGTINMPVSANGWNCDCYNKTTTTKLNAIAVGAGTTTSIPLTQVVQSTNAAANFAPSDHIGCQCTGF